MSTINLLPSNISYQKSIQRNIRVMEEELQTHEESWLEHMGKGMYLFNFFFRYLFKSEN